jgi:membrane protease YdiL (CAAX protease family)
VEIDLKESSKRLVAFFALTFALSWLLWLPQVLDSQGLVQLPEAIGILGMFAPFGPFIAAALLTWRQQGGAGLRKLLKRGWSLGFDKAWLLPTLLMMPVISLITVGVLLLLGLPIQWEYGRSLAALGPTFLMALFLNALPEEYGWRGYALGRMLGRGNALLMSLLLGGIWGLWHLPLHFIEGTVQVNIPVYQFVVQQMVLAVFYTWLFNNTRGAVSVAILFHAIGNTVAAAVPTWTTNQGRWISLIVLVVFVVAINLIWGPRHLSRSPEARYKPALDDA